MATGFVKDSHDMDWIADLVQEWDDVAEKYRGQKPPRAEFKKLSLIRESVVQALPNDMVADDAIHYARLLLLSQNGAFCHWCGCCLDISPSVRHYQPSQAIPESQRNNGVMWRATLDHLYPRSLGGSSRLSNLVLSCGPCNVARGNKVATEAVEMKS